MSLTILTWHVHGSYLYYLAHARHRFVVPVKRSRPEAYGGRAPHWPDNVVEIPAEEVRELDVDLVLYQAHRNYLEDQYEICSERQRHGPRIFLEHDPPREHPTDTRHPVDDPGVLLVHVTPFNDLMWNSGVTPTTVIDHGVTVPPGTSYRGDVAKGVAVVNGLDWRGRRVGADVFERVRKEVPIDLIGMGSEKLGGLGEIPHDRLLDAVTRYRFLFNPIRYTSLGLSVCEAMMAGVPIVGLATTEMSVVVENGVSGWIDTSIDRLVPKMQRLLENEDEARHLGAGARRMASARFSIERFVADWERVFDVVASGRTDVGVA